MLIKQILHEQNVSVYSLDGQPLLLDYCPIPGSLTLRELKYATSPTFQTHACELIHLLPLNKPDYPHDLPFPEDLPESLVVQQSAAPGIIQMLFQTHPAAAQAVSGENSLFEDCYAVQQAAFETGISVEDAKRSLIDHVDIIGSYEAVAPRLLT